MTTRTLPVIAAFSHALKSTWNNLGFAFHASLPWLVVLVPVSIYIDVLLKKFAPADPQGPPAQLTPEQIQSVLMFYAMLFVSILIYSSIAVTWHRYILKDEVPNGLARLRMDGTVWRYVGNTFLVALMLMAMAFPLLGLAVVITMASGSQLLSFVALAGVAAVIAPLFYRLSVKLPAIAVGQPNFRFSDAWNATRGSMFPLFLLAVLTLLLVLGVGVILGAVEAILLRTAISGMEWVAAILRQLVSWVFSIFTITILTSLYGYFVEKRDF